MLSVAVMNLRTLFNAGYKAKKHRLPFPGKNFLLFLFLLWMPFSFAFGVVYQKHNSDSLRVVKWLKEAKNLKPAAAMAELDSAERIARKFNFQVLLARIYIERGDLGMKADDLLSADSNYRLAHAILINRAKDTGYLFLLKKLAICSYYLGNNQNVLNYTLSGLEEAQKLHNRSLEGTFNNIAGIAMAGMGNNADALNYYQRSLDIFKSLKDEEKIASVEMNLGVLNEQQKDLEKAEHYYWKALISAQKIQDTTLMSAAYNNLANIYSAHKNYRKALEYLFKSLALSRMVNDRYTEALDLNNIGDAYQKLKEYDKAFDFYNKALQLARKIHSTRTLGISLSSLSEIYELKGNIPQAIVYATKSWELVKKGGDVSDALNSLKQLEKLYAQKGDYVKAYNFLQQYVTLHDSIYSAKNRARLEKERMRYAFKAKDQSLKLARERQKLFRAYLIVSLFALLLVILAGLFMIRLRVVRNRELKKRMSFVDNLLEYSESFVLVLDRNMKISYLSPSYQKAFGHFFYERKGSNPFDFIYPDDIPALKEKLRDFFDGKQQRVEISFRLQKSNGEYRYMQGVFNNRLGNPDLNGYVLNFWDVTELRKTQQAISESERKYYDIFNAFPDIYFRIDARGVVEEISPSVKSVAGYDREEVLGKSLYDFVEMDREWPRIRKILHRLQQVKDYNLTLRTKNGKQIYCSLNIHDLIDANGRLSGFEGVLRDITDRVLAEKQLRTSECELKEANASKDKILSIIGHDLLGPIGTQKSILDMVIDDVEDFTREEILSLLKTMKPSLDATYTMIENLLSWARIMRRSIKPNRQKENLASVVAKSFDLLQQQAAQKNIRLVYEGDEEVNAVFDKNLIDIVIRNLLSNAIKFSNPDSTIRLTVTRGDKEVVVSVADQGMGLTKEQIEKILKEKEKMESRLGTRKEKGTGLGLVVVKEFIQMNKGKLSIESEPGKGTVFSFTLPVE
jgi:PAS domain S-box-containing protein